jgi:glycine C-acetyltransferase
MITDDEKFLKKISGNTTKFREGMTMAGFEIAGENHPICPGFINQILRLN